MRQTEPTAAPAREGSEGSRLVAAVREYLALLEAGRGPSRSEFLARHPDVAGELADCLSGLELVHSVAPELSGGRPVPVNEELGGGALGDFRLVREVGRGGMGVVYEAEQISLGRRVALKVLPFAATMDPRQLQRFHNEARAAAGLEHAHIVPVYGVGCERGVHFYAMKFIDGQTLAELIARQAPGSDDVTAPYARPAADTRPLAADATSPTPRDDAFFRRAAEWGAQAAEALEYAHSLGVVHRDVKPANLLIDRQGKLWVADFGLARTGADSGLTMTGDVLGTLRYMSPEQALARHGLVDHRSDVYALGATLYELLTGSPAVGGKDRAEVLHNIAAAEPRPPRALVRAVPAELETVVLKCLEKEPKDRYASARELGDDLRRWLADEPVRARRPTLAQRARKWARRHRGLVGAAAAMLAVVSVVAVAAAALIGAAYTEEARHRQKAEEQEGLAVAARGEEARLRAEADEDREASEGRTYRAEMRLAQQAWQDADFPRLNELLERHRPRPGRPDRRGWEWYYLRSLVLPAAVTFRAHSTHLWQQGCGGWSPSGALLAYPGLEAGTVEVRDLAAPARPRVLDAGGGRGGGGVADVTWAPSGKRLAARGADGAVRVWDAAGWKQVARLEGAGRFAWSPDGARLAFTGNFAGVKVWDIGQAKVALAFGNNRIAHELCWSPDGKRLAVVWVNKDCELWTPITGRHELTMHWAGPTVLPNFTAWSPDGKYLATSRGGGQPRVWEAASGRLVATLAVKGAATRLAWAPKGQRLATLDSEVGALTVWDASAGKALFSLPRGSTGLAWSPDGQSVAIDRNIGDGTLVVLDGATGAERGAVRGANGQLIGWSADGRWLATTEAGEVRVFDASRPQEHLVLQRHKSWVTALDWGPGGRLAVGDGDGAVGVWDVAGGRAPVALSGPAGRSGRGGGLAWSPDGDRIADAGALGKDATTAVRVWSLRSGALERTLRVAGGPQRTDRSTTGAPLAWSPDGRLLVGGHNDWTLRVRDARLGKEVHKIDPGQVCLALAWCPAGSPLAGADADGIIRLWDARTWREVAALPGHSEAGLGIAVAWSRDGKRLASGGGEGVKLWSPDGRLLRHVRGQTNVNSVAWSPDGRRLASAGRAGVKVWDASSGEELLHLPGRSLYYSRLAWSRDGRRLAAAAHPDNTVVVWDATPGYDVPGPAPAASATERWAGALTQANFARALARLERLPEAERAYREAIGLLRGLGEDLKGDSEARRLLAELTRELGGGGANTGGTVRVRAARRLGRDLIEQRRLDEAVAQYRKVVQLDPGSADARAVLAELCLAHQKRPAEAAGLYRQAFADDPRLVQGLSPHRYNAACAAALTGTGQGGERPALDAAARARWRGQALAWLRDELSATALLWRAQPRAAVFVREKLAHWRADPDLAGVRGAALAKLGDAERRAWSRLWAEADRLERAGGRPRP